MSGDVRFIRWKVLCIHKSWTDIDVQGTYIHRKLNVFERRRNDKNVTLRRMPVNVNPAMCYSTLWCDYVRCTYLSIFSNGDHFYHRIISVRIVDICRMPVNISGKV